MANNIRYFQYMSAYTAAQEAYSIDVPNVSYIQDEDVVKYQEHYEVGAYDVLLKLTDGTYEARTFSNGVMTWAAFRGRRDIEEAIIGSGFTTIINEAFASCSSLTSITIPNSVTNINDGAFRGCSSLPSVTIPDGVTIIDKSAFYDCQSITSLTIGSSVSIIGNLSFARLYNLSSVTIPESVSSISGASFNDCKIMQSVTCLPLIPPTGVNNGCFYAANNNYPIYVPAESVEAYKEASGWSDYASRIQAIPNS